MLYIWYIIPQGCNTVDKNTVSKTSRLEGDRSDMTVCSCSSCVYHGFSNKIIHLSAPHPNIPSAAPRSDLDRRQQNVLEVSREPMWSICSWFGQLMSSGPLYWRFGLSLGSIRNVSWRNYKKVVTDAIINANTVKVWGWFMLYILKYAVVEWVNVLLLSLQTALDMARSAAVNSSMEKSAVRRRDDPLGQSLKVGNRGHMRLLLTFFFTI
mgnify:CR=1 FL=1